MAMRTNSTRPLTERQEKYARAVASGVPSREAALAAGYGPEYAKKAAQRLKDVAPIAKVIEDIQQKGRDLAAYGLAQALQDCDDAATFAYAKGNPMAVVKAHELKSKLAGLLIERVAIVAVDLKGSLDAAKARAQQRSPLRVTLDLGVGVGPAPVVPEAHAERNEFREQAAFGD